MRELGDAAATATARATANVEGQTRFSSGSVEGKKVEIETQRLHRGHASEDWTKREGRHYECASGMRCCSQRSMVGA